MTTTTSSGTALESSSPVIGTSYDGYGNESIYATYNISLGQAPLDINPVELPTGEYIVKLDIPYLNQGWNSNTVPGGLNVPSQYDDQTGYSNYYMLTFRYGQGTASLMATSLSTGAVSTVATVHDVATMLINGQWQPVQGFIDISSLGGNGFYLDPGPKVLTDQTGGTTTSQSLELSGNVAHYLAQRYNFADGEVVNIADNGVQVGSATIHSTNDPGTQNYLGPNDTAFDTTINLTPGDNAITITTTDANGLTGSASLNYTYTPSGSGGGTAIIGGNGTASGGTGNTTGTGTGGSTGGSGGVIPSDSITIDPTATFLGHGAFELTGHASSTAGVKQVELSADIDGVTTDLGAATLHPDGSFVYTDQVGAHIQSFITATLTDGAGQSAAAEAGFDLQAGRGGTPYVAMQNVYDPATGDLGSTAWFQQDGSRAVQVAAPGQTLTATGSDTFHNAMHADTTFVFNPGYGYDTVKSLLLGGPDHDTISLPASDFTSIADVLAHAHQGTAGTTIYDPASGDMLRLANISKAQLAHHSDIFTLA